MCGELTTQPHVRRTRGPVRHPCLKHTYRGECVILKPWEVGNTIYVKIYTKCWGFDEDVADFRFDLGIEYGATVVEVILICLYKLNSWNRKKTVPDESKNKMRTTSQWSWEVTFMDDVQVEDQGHSSLSYPSGMRRSQCLHIVYPGSWSPVVSFLGGLCGTSSEQGVANWVELTSHGPSEVGSRMDGTCFNMITEVIKLKLIRTTSRGNQCRGDLTMSRHDGDLNKKMSQKPPHHGSSCRFPDPRLLVQIPIMSWHCQFEKWGGLWLLWHEISHCVCFYFYLKRMRRKVINH
jgi:hypothetical protein